MGWAVSRENKLMTRLRRKRNLFFSGLVVIIYFFLLYQISTDQIKCLQFHGKTVKLILDEKQINTKKKKTEEDEIFLISISRFHRK